MSQDNIPTIFPLIVPEKTVLLGITTPKDTTTSYYSSLMKAKDEDGTLIFKVVKVPR